jgi:glycosyltransferase involved in cell wall biosynthesis
MRKISVVICVFNEEYCILKALKSLKKNHIYNDTEIIIVDDASYNPITLRLLELLKKLQRYIIIHSPKNLGLSNSRNLGFGAVTSSYVMPLDADDVFPDYTIDKIFNTFEQNKDIDFIFGDYNICDENLNYQTVNCIEISKNQQIDIQKLFSNWTLLGTSPCTKKIWQKNKGYSLKYSNTVQDVDFWIRTLKLGARGLYLPEVIYKWNRFSHGMNENYDRKDYYILLEEHYAFINRYYPKNKLANIISEGYYKCRLFKKMLLFNLPNFNSVGYKNHFRWFLLFLKINLKL